VILQEEVLVLRAENVELRREVADLRTLLTTAEARIAELEQEAQQASAKRTPSFVKANRPKRQTVDGKRKKRAAEHNHARRREKPTRIECHALDRCPICNYPLRGESIDYTRQVIEIPPPPPVEIIEHQVIKRRCPHCRVWRSPTLDLSQQVLGQGRIGVRVASLIAYLRTTLRLTVRQIQRYLETVHRLWLSAGEIIALCHQVHERANETIESLKQEIRQSPVIHGDETGWREDGQSGYIWLLRTPGIRGVCYFEYDRSRGQAVADRLLRGVRDACLVSDFYVGYNNYAGPQQRCWAHLLRALHELKEEHAEDASVLTWAGEVRRVYDDAQAWRTVYPTARGTDRAAMATACVQRVVVLGKQYTWVYDHPCNALAKRLLRHQDELFQFITRDGVSADNNLAERTLRPLVVIRKISGGTRSDQGTKTRLGLASLFATWHGRGLNPFTECIQLLSHSPP
jgi:hypothetical protein